MLKIVENVERRLLEMREGFTGSRLSNGALIDGDKESDTSG
jgi:hypothetical protein